LLRFANPVAYDSGGVGANSVAIADLNGDGIPDLVVANVNQNGNSDLGEVAVLLGNGDGTFQPAATYGIEEYAYTVALADLRGIGVLDVIVVDINPVGYECAAGVLLGNGDGTFQPVVDYNSGGFGCQSAAVADLNGDGIPDIVATNACQSESCQGDSSVGVLLGNGNGTFQPPVTYVLNGTEGGKVAIGDVSGDGIPDLAVTDECPKLKDGACTGSKVIVLLGNGDGTFQPEILYGSGGFGLSDIAIGDVNGDGRPDLVVSNYCQGIQYGLCEAPGTAAVL